MKSTPNAGARTWIAASFIFACFCGWSQQTPAPPMRVLPARLTATVYQVEVNTNLANPLDAAAVSDQAGTDATLLKALAAAGKARLLYHLDQPVNALSETINFGASEPYIRGSIQAANGQTVNNTSYVNFGLIVRLSAVALPDANDNGLTISTRVQIAVPTTTNLTNSGFLNSLLINTGSLEFDRPQVMLANGRLGVGRDASQTNATPPIVYVVRYVFSKPIAESSISEAATPSKAAAATADEFPVQFEANVYEVRIPMDKLMEADGTSLNRRSASLPMLFDTLKALGQPQSLYHIDQPVNVLHGQIQMSHDEQAVAAVSYAHDGKPIEARTPLRVGATVRLSSQFDTNAPDHQMPKVNMSFNFSTPFESEVSAAPGFKMTSTRTWSIVHAEPLEFGQPRIMLALRSLSASELDTPTLYIVRYVFNPPSDKSPTNGSGAK